jgi:DNA (cytosine-5)-methyltransferase 1
MAFAQNQLGEVRVGEVFNTLNTNSNASGRNTAMVAYPVDSSVSYAAPAIGTLVSSDVAGTLMKNNGAGSGETQNAAYIQSHMAVRRLTPVECERLMGFSDGHTRIPWRKKPASECPDGPRYKALGNSMAVNCMRFIGERIALVDAVFSELDAAAQVEAEVP